MIKTRVFKLVLCTALSAATVLSLTGCFLFPEDNKNSNENNSTSSTSNSVPSSQNQGSAQQLQAQPRQAYQPQLAGVFYDRQILVDQQLGVGVFSAFYPDGWSVSVNSNWEVMSSAVPGMEEIVFTSPDGCASIVIDSCQAYSQNEMKPEGADFETYTTYLHYMNAKDFTDYYMTGAFGGDAHIENEFPDDPNTLAWLSQYNDLLVAQGRSTIAAVLNGAAPDMAAFLDPAEVMTCRRQYQLPNGGFAETSCATAAQIQTITSPVLTETTIHWRVPYSIVYSAVDKTAFDQYYEAYLMIVENSYFTPEYYSAEDYVSSAITSAAMEAKAAAAGVGTSMFSSSGYQSSDAVSTNEKLIGMWDDCITEKDTYTTLDGSAVKVSIHDDVVAQNGDQIYVGRGSRDVPDGFNILSKR